MQLPESLISQFAKLTKDSVKTKTERTVYGTVVGSYDDNGKEIVSGVKIDGSEEDSYIPLKSNTTVKVGIGDRVTTLIKNHRAIITGNLGKPATNEQFVTNVVTGAITEKIEPKLALTIDEKSKVATLSAHANKISIKGNKITIECDDFTLDDTGKITATGGEIAGFVMAKTANNDRYLRRTDESNEKVIPFVITDLPAEAFNNETGVITFPEGKPHNYTGVTSHKLQSVSHDASGNTKATGMSGSGGVDLVGPNNGYARIYLDENGDLCILSSNKIRFSSTPINDLLDQT